MCNRYIANMLQGCYIGDTGELKEWLMAMGVIGVLQECPMGVTGVVHGCYREFTGVA